MFPSRIVSVLGEGAFENNYSLAFDGSTSYVEIADSDDFSFGDGSTDSAFSISAWVKTDDATDFTIAHKGEFSNDIEWRFSTYNDDDIKLICGDDSAGTAYIGRRYTDTPLTSYEGSWIHLVATYSGSGRSDGIKIYLNGVQVDDANYESGSYTAMENQGEPVQIGRYGTAYSDGNIDGVAIWNTALDGDSIRAIWNNGVPTNLKNNTGAYDEYTDNLVAYYRCGDGTLDEYPLIGDEVTPTLGSDEAPNNTSATNSSRTEANATGNWNSMSITGSDTYESVSSEPQNGSYHLRVDNNTGAFRGFYDNGLTLTNGVYKLMYDYKIVSGANLYVQVVDNGGSVVFSDSSNSSDSWSNDNVAYFNSTESGSSAEVRFMTNDGVGEFYVDNIRLYPVNGNAGFMKNMSESDIAEDTP